MQLGFSDDERDLPSGMRRAVNGYVELQLANSAVLKVEAYTGGNRSIPRYSQNT